MNYNKTCDAITTNFCYNVSMQSFTSATENRMETFGNRLERLRHARGLSRYAVAKGAGLSQPLMKHLEGVRSGRTVSGGTLERLAAFFNMTIEELLGPPDTEEEDHQAA
jgi:transcriptional regulator with XRE-family HTH domain